MHGVRHLGGQCLGIDDFLFQQQVTQSDQLVAMLADDASRPGPLALEKRTNAGIERLAGTLGQVRLLAAEVTDLEVLECAVLGFLARQPVAEVLDEVGGEHGRTLEIVGGALTVSTNELAPVPPLAS